MSFISSSLMWLDFILFCSTFELENYITYFMQHSVEINNDDIKFSAHGAFLKKPSSGTIRVNIVES